MCDCHLLFMDTVKYMHYVGVMGTSLCTDNVLEKKSIHTLWIIDLNS